MCLGAVSLRLDFLHYEEACIQKSFNAVGQAALFTPREPRRRRTSDASVAKKSWLYGGRRGERPDKVEWEREKKVEKNALVPAQTGKGVDGLLDTRLRLLPVKESLEFFLEGKACQY